MKIKCYVQALRTSQPSIGGINHYRGLLTGMYVFSTSGGEEVSSKLHEDFTHLHITFSQRKDQINVLNTRFHIT